MEFAAATALVERLMAMYGFRSVPVRWTRSVKTFGTVWYDPGAITPASVVVVEGEVMLLERRMYCIRRLDLSKPITLLNDEPVVAEQVLHEIAHMLDIRERGRTAHDDRWREVARSIGSLGEPRFSPAHVRYPQVLCRRRWVSQCGTCKVSWYSSTQWQTDHRYCSHCKAAHPDDPGKYTIYQVPNPHAAGKGTKRQGGQS